MTLADDRLMTHSSLNKNAQADQRGWATGARLSATDSYSNVYFSALVFWVLLLMAASQTSYARGALELTAGFPLEVNGRKIEYGIDFEPVLPGEEVVFSTHRNLAARMSVTVESKPLARDQRSFVWRAPATPGLRTATVTLAPERAGQKVETVTLKVFVMVPVSKVKNGYLNGYRIGQYPSPLRNLNAYRAPRGYIEVTAANASTSISPNFTLQQFLCKQAGGYPKYLVLQPRLLTKLEGLLLEVNERGREIESFVIMSGYRTPFYNAAIGNSASSYHIYGGAADIYVDVKPRDGVMDDLNGDGKQNRADAAYLYRMADSYVRRHERLDLKGGVGEYGSNAAHGPFVHIDVRGSSARWGHSH